MKKFFFLLSALTSGLYAAELTLDRYDARDVAAVCAIESTLKTVYLRAFERVYKDYWTAEFEQLDRDYFDSHVEKLKHDNQMFIVAAKKNGTVAGWIFFSCHEQSAIIDIICIDPAFQQQGIGKALIFSIRDYVPAIKTIQVATRRINAISPLFYEKVGFVKTNFVPEDFTADEVQGYELNLDTDVAIT